MHWTRWNTTLPYELSAIPIAINMCILTNNILVLLTIKRMQSLQIHHRLMLGLVFAELTTVIPTAVLSGIVINGSILLTATLCDVLGLLITMTFELTVCIHCLMCVEKLLSVVKPIRHRSFTKWKKAGWLVGCMVVGCLAFTLLFNLVMLSLGVVEFAFEPNIPQCALTNDNGAPSYQSTVGIFILSPMLLQVVTHGIIFHKISKMQATGRKRIKKAIRTLSLTVGLYYVCWMPVLILQVWRIAFGSKPPQIFTFAGIQILMSHSGISGIIYYISLPDFRAAFRSIVKRSSCHTPISPAATQSPRRPARVSERITVSAIDTL